LTDTACLAARIYTEPDHKLRVQAYRDIDARGTTGLTTLFAGADRVTRPLLVISIYTEPDHKLRVQAYRDIDARGTTG